MDELEVHIIYLIDSRAHNNLFSVISFDPQKYKGMMEKIKLSEVERGLPNGIIAQIRGLNTQGEGILEPLDSFLSDILCARGSFIYNSQEVIDNLKKPGVYKHGDPIIGTGTSYGAHGVLLVLYIDEYTIHIDFPARKNFILVRKCVTANGKDEWSSWKYISLTDIST
jgi:hypothetical protein